MPNALLLQVDEAKALFQEAVSNVSLTIVGIVADSFDTSEAQERTFRQAVSMK